MSYFKKLFLRLLFNLVVKGSFIAMKFLQWNSNRMIKSMEPTSSLHTEFAIPDFLRPNLRTSKDGSDSTKN